MSTTPQLIKMFFFNLFNSPLTSANKTHHDKLRTERDTKKFRNCVVECEHIFFNQTCNGGCNIGLKFRNEKHEFIRTRLNDFASKTLFVLPDIFPVQVVLLKRFLPRKCYIVYLFCVVQTRGFCHFFLKVEQQNSKFAPRCRSPHVVVRPTLSFAPRDFIASCDWLTTLTGFQQI